MQPLSHNFGIFMFDVQWLNVGSYYSGIDLLLLIDNFTLSINVVYSANKGKNKAIKHSLWMKSVSKSQRSPFMVFYKSSRHWMATAVQQDAGIYLFTGTTLVRASADISHDKFVIWTEIFKTCQKV